MPIPALKDNYIWAIVHPNSGQCVIVDPGEAEPVLQSLKRHHLTLQAILVTHHHWDHTNGIEALYKKFLCPVIGPRLENIPYCKKKVQEGDLIGLDDIGLTLKVLDIPGHTLGHIAYYGHGWAFTGDTLFTGGCGRIFEGSAQQMWASLNKLMSLPDETLVYCGHEYTLSNLHFAYTVEPQNSILLERIEATEGLRAQHLPCVPAPLSLEKQTNPFLRVENKVVQEAIKNHFKMDFNQLDDYFAALREWKNSFSK